LLAGAPRAAHDEPAAAAPELFRRDFTGSCSLFGVVFKPRFTHAQVCAWIDGLALFGIGASWGGFESLALPTSGNITRTATKPEFGGEMARIHIGLEDTSDLIADLEAGLNRMAG
jgi:cystathionine beta-lyase